MQNVNAHSLTLQNVLVLKFQCSLRVFPKLDNINFISALVYTLILSPVSLCYTLYKTQVFSEC